MQKCADCLIFIAAVFDDQSRHGHQMRDVRYRRAFSHFGSMRSPRGLSIQPWQRLSTRRKSAPPIMTPFHSIATDWSRDSPRRSSFFAAIRPAYITGQTIAVDGGFEATGIGLPALRAKERTEQAAGDD